MDVEATLIRAALEAEGWNQSGAARRLGITESKIRNRMKQYGIRRSAKS
jgi:DNA-binding NtrC family response regulator